MPPRPTVGCSLRRVAVALLLSAVCLTPLTAHADAEVERLNQEAVQLYQRGDFGRALTLAKATLDRATEILGERDPTILTLLDNYAVMLQAVGRHSEAELIYKRALNLSIETIGPEHPDTLTSLKNYARILQILGRDAEAEQIYKRVVDFYTETLGPEHPDTLASVNIYAVMLRTVGRTTEAEAIVKNALNLSTEILGPKHLDTIIILSNYATILFDLGRTMEAEILLKNVLSLRTEILGPKHPDTLTSIDKYATVLRFLDRALDAEPLHKKTLNLQTEILGEKHPDTLITLNNYAATLRALGKNAEAEPLYKRAYEIFSETLGEKHQYTLTALNNYAITIQYLGREMEAKKIMENIITIQNETTDYKSNEYINSIVNYASNLENTGRIDSAAEIYKHALDIRMQIYGENHYDTISTINYYAGSLILLGRSSEAIPLLDGAIKNCIKVFGENHLLTLASINNKALALHKIGMTAEAEPLYKQVVNLNIKHNGGSHPSTLNSVLNYASVLISLNRIDKALDQLEWGVTQLHYWVGEEMRSMTRDVGRRNVVTLHSSWTDVILTVALQHPSPRAVELAAQTLLRWKHRATEEDAHIARLMSRTQEPAIRDKAIEANRLRRDVAALARYDKNGGFQATAERLDTLLRDLRQSQHKPALFSAAQIATPAMIASQLPDGAVLVEFRLYHRIDFNTGDRSATRFAALLIEQGKPLLIYDAGDMVELAQHLRLARQGDRVAASKAFALAFGPAKQRFDNVATIFIAPDGPLWDVSPAVLRTAENSPFWLKDKSLRIIATGRDLLFEPSSNPAVGVTVIGGVNFGAPKTAGALRSVEPIDSSPAALMRNRQNALSPLSPLKHSEKEVSFLENLYGGVADPVTALYGPTATEAALKRLPKPPKVLHLATHGDYRALEKFSDRPEVMSWVALAGANRGLEGEVDADGEDGLLTALEVAGLSLEGTELVALSACLTGAGHKDYSEGLIGLTRAFRIAGARRVLAALRTVPDNLTADFMIAFHRQWLADGMKDAHESLRRVQLAFANHPNRRKRNPAFWGAFVMIGP